MYYRFAIGIIIYKIYVHLQFCKRGFLTKGVFVVVWTHTHTNKIKYQLLNDESICIHIEKLFRKVVSIYVSMFDSYVYIHSLIVLDCRLSIISITRTEKYVSDKDYGTPCMLSYKLGLQLTRSLLRFLAFSKAAFLVRAEQEPTIGTFMLTY